jgi:hypothetical protein
MVEKMYAVKQNDLQVNKTGFCFGKVVKLNGFVAEIGFWSGYQSQFCSGGCFIVLAVQPGKDYYCILSGIYNLFWFILFLYQNGQSFESNREK